MSLDDLIFYLPALGSVAFLGVSLVLTWVVLRLYGAWKKKKAVEKSGKT